jgi:predicted TIM-barrel fold metal-dependent hydrolase
MREETMSTHESAARIRAGLAHPVIDADGHWLEFGPQVREALRKIGGEAVALAFDVFPKAVERQLRMSVAERRRRRTGQQAFWALPTRNTRDRATAVFPRLLHERLPELGFDFAVLYPTAALGLPFLGDEVRAATCRAFNVFCADHFGPYADRLTPAAVIPMHTPDEAVQALEHAVRELGLKVAVFGSLIPRLVPSLAEEHPEAARLAPWRDPLGLDSAHDYDPVWAKCLELGIAPTFHTGGRGFHLRTSPSNFVYNHIGHFAAASEAVCKALFLGGVTRRFPELRFGFLEGGVGFACQLFADLIGHWEKRSRAGLEDVDPRNLDRELFLRLAQRYAPPEVAAAFRDPDAVLETGMTQEGNVATGGIDELDDFSACGIRRLEDFRDLFVRSFYFGCEADDRMNAWAFSSEHNPLGARLHAMFGSDIGHFDVPDMAAVLPEAYELVEDGLLDAERFADFVFKNAVRFFTAARPDFFVGTSVEAAVSEESA